MPWFRLHCRAFSNKRNRVILTCVEDAANACRDHTATGRSGAAEANFASMDVGCTWEMHIYIQQGQCGELRSTQQARGDAYRLIFIVDGWI